MHMHHCEKYIGISSYQTLCTCFHEFKYQSISHSVVSNSIDMHVQNSIKAIVVNVYLSHNEAQKFILSRESNVWQIWHGKKSAPVN